MFTSHKSDGPLQSRQSSVDSPAIRPSSPASISGAWDPQCFDDYPYGAMQSPEQRHRAYSSKRSSVFNLRARSNTAASTASTTPSIMSLNAPGSAYVEMSRLQSPIAFLHSGCQGHTELAGSRKSLFRGRRGKRVSDSCSANLVMPEYQETGMGSDKRISVLRKGKSRNHEPDTLSHGLKHRISSPFGFQHLTHTDRHKFAAVEQTPGDKLAAGFRVHTSQVLANEPNEIRNSDLHFINFSSENLADQVQRSPSASSFISPPQSPQMRNELQQSSATIENQAPRPTLRLIRSVESFSQPGVNLRNHRHSQSVVAPPRLSSLPPIGPIDDVAKELPLAEQRTPSSRYHSKRESGIWDSFSLAAAAAEPHLPGIRDDSIYVGHAFTTPGDTAIQAMTPPIFSPSLDDVAEEPERYIRPRPAPRPPMKPPTTPKSPEFNPLIFSYQRSPVARLHSRGNSHTSPRSLNQMDSTSRPASQMSDTLGSPELTQRISARRPFSTHRQSNTWRVPEQSWEDDVDYAYEHAMEADCDFEWDCVSDGEHDESPRNALNQGREDGLRTAYNSTQQPLSPIQRAFEPSSQYHDPDFRASLLVPSPFSVPDLEPTSATSASTMETGLTTPCDPFNNTSLGVAEGFILSPSLLIPQEYKEGLEHTYEDLLDDYNDSERHFHLPDPRHSATSSARSRRSSYDSSLMSSIQSSGMWSSPIRRSASSAGSIPDLVPSRRNRRDVTFSLTVDQFADSISSLSHLDEEKEDDDITPPGRILETITFFPTEETEEQTTSQTSIENELRASLEFARRGSQRVESQPINREIGTSLDVSRNNSKSSTPAPAHHHRQTKSDGGAKILATGPALSEGRPSKSRSRAATTQPARSPLLSLFPSPPRNSRPPTQM